MMSPLYPSIQETRVPEKMSLTQRDLGIGATIDIGTIPLAQKYAVAVLLGVGICETPKPHCSCTRMGMISHQGLHNLF